MSTRTQVLALTQGLMTTRTTQTQTHHRHLVLDLTIRARGRRRMTGATHAEHLPTAKIDRRLLWGHSSFTSGRSSFRNRGREKHGWKNDYLKRQAYEGVVNFCMMYNCDCPCLNFFFEHRVAWYYTCTSSIILFTSFTCNQSLLLSGDVLMSQGCSAL